MMKFETKWKWFKRFLSLATVAAGGLLFLSVSKQDLALFVAAFSLVIGIAAHQIMIGFIDAMSNDPWLKNVVPRCRKCGKPMVLTFYDRPGGPPGNMFVCDCEEGS